MTGFGPVTVRPSDPRYASLTGGYNYRFLGSPDYYRLAGSATQIEQAVGGPHRPRRRRPPDRARPIPPRNPVASLCPSIDSLSPGTSSGRCAGPLESGWSSTRVSALFRQGLFEITFEPDS
ncbi:hypothetical protein GCM10017786_60920 [Amycolatopsis deserti]|uniref:Uncharacterized protein n=1 Tax=Amycolatopsis deserti TaxID=185696 RepID=A0ABQ3JFA6_9PSEU|nr:hypothetical protein GCM10017786_60920 [Amycolatopsis deserti]